MPASVRGRPDKRFDESVAGIGGAGRVLSRHRVELVAVEATGGYERLGFARCGRAGTPVAIVNPRGVRRFAEGMGMLEKTDRIDAGVIAWYAEVKRDQAHPPPARPSKAQALVTRLRQLTQLRVVQDQPAPVGQRADVLKSFQEMLAVLAREIRELEAKIAKLIERRSAVAGVRSGVPLDQGRRRSHRRPADGRAAGDRHALRQGGARSSPGLPRGSRRRQASGKRSVRGGREGIRSVLFVVVDWFADMTPIPSLPQGLEHAGKPPRRARRACP